MISTASLEEDEDYPVKCLCGVEYKDGSTLLCPSCKTLQHVACYNYVLDTEVNSNGHHCADCRRHNLIPPDVLSRMRWLRK